MNKKKEKQNIFNNDWIDHFFFNQFLDILKLFKIPQIYTNAKIF